VGVQELLNHLLVLLLITFNRYQGMALAAVAALTGVALSIQKIIDINGKLSDAQSDVMKMGMTKDEVDELTKSFGLLHTPFF
jgi:tubulin-specific chaperone A